MTAQLRETLNKYAPTAAGLFLLFLILFLLQKNDSIQKEQIVAKTMIAASEARNQATLKENEKLEASIIVLNDKVLNLARENEKNKARVRQIRKERDEKILAVKTYQRPELEKYFQDRYKAAAEVKANDVGLSVSDTICKAIATDLINGDAAVKEVAVAYDIVDNVSTQSELKDSIIAVKDQKLSNLTSVIEENQNVIQAQQEIAKAQADAIKNIEKDLKKSKVNKTIWQVATVAAFIGGFLIAK